MNPPPVVMSLVLKLWSGTTHAVPPPPASESRRRALLKMASSAALSPCSIHVCVIVPPRALSFVPTVLLLARLKLSLKITAAGAVAARPKIRAVTVVRARVRVFMVRAPVVLVGSWFLVRGLRSLLILRLPLLGGVVQAQRCLLRRYAYGPNLRPLLAACNNKIAL